MTTRAAAANERVTGRFPAGCLLIGTRDAPSAPWRIRFLPGEADCSGPRVSRELAALCPVFIRIELAKSHADSVLLRTFGVLADKGKRSVADVVRADWRGRVVCDRAGKSVGSSGLNCIH